MSAWQWMNIYGQRPIEDTLSALIFDNLFGRFPGLKVLVAEHGAEWVPQFVIHMDKSRGMGRNGPWIGGKLTETPSEIFRRHVGVVPYPEDDTPAIVESLGYDECLLMGSDYPHAEGLAEPADFVKLLDPLDDAAKKRIMRDNADRCSPELDRWMGDDDVDLDLLRESAREFLAERGSEIPSRTSPPWIGQAFSSTRPRRRGMASSGSGRRRGGTRTRGGLVDVARLCGGCGGVGIGTREVRDRWLPAMLDGYRDGRSGAVRRTVRVTNGEAIDILVTLGAQRNSSVRGDRCNAEEPDNELLDVNRATWRVELSGAPGVLIGGPERAEQLLAVARVLLSADSLGALSATFARLVAYLKDRVAFGAPIASFQAVQHRLVDLLVLEVKARAAVMKAARAMASEDASDDAVALSAVAHAFVRRRPPPRRRMHAAVGRYRIHLGVSVAPRTSPRVHNGYLLGTARASRAVLAEKAGW